MRCTVNDASVWSYSDTDLAASVPDAGAGETYAAYCIPRSAANQMGGLLNRVSGAPIAAAMASSAGLTGIQRIDANTERLWKDDPTSLPPVFIAPRAVDTTSPGVGINLNLDATDFEAGAVVDLVGKFVASKRIIDDPVYVANAAGMVAYLHDLPFALLEDETVHAPEPVIDI